jgi:hypothetical protein
VTSPVEIENQAGLARVTCGWKLPHLSLDNVRPYWRDAHSPTIARRDGVWEYRHYPLDPVRADLFSNLPGIDYQPGADQQLMWLSDVRYFDQAGLDAFGKSPNPEVRAQILQDIEMIVHQSTTYLVDKTGVAAPAGPAQAPTFGVFLRAKGDEASFRATVKAMVERWAQTAGVLRVRLALFEVPDMEAERRGGYPVKTHPLELQYQAWIDLMIEDDSVARRLMTAEDGVDYAKDIKDLHAYPSPAVYTFNYQGRPTLAGLRGYPAVEAIRNLGAEHQKDVGLLEWLYGPVAKGGPAA